MIVSWKHKGLQRFYETGSTKGINVGHAKRLRRVLLILDSAISRDGAFIGSKAICSATVPSASAVTGASFFVCWMITSNWLITLTTIEQGHYMGMHNPPHPGEILLEDVMPSLGITITEMARRLGFARETFSRILHGHAPVSPDLAVRLERAGISKARLWLSMQSTYDLWQAEHREQPFIERFAQIE